MSRNQRRRQTHSKRKKIVNKSRYKKQNSLNLKKRLSTITFSSIQNNISSKLSKIKNSIFKTRDYKKIVVEFVDDIKRYTKKNKKSVIFSVSIFAICFIGYFAVVYETDEIKANRILNSSQQTVSVNLSETVDEEVEIAISEPISNVEIFSEELIVLEANKVKEQAAAIELITADIITKDVSSLTFSTIAENKNYIPVSESIKLGINVYAIKVDDKEVAYLQTKNEADGVVDTLKEKYRLEDAVEDKIVFRENVEVVKVKRDIFDFDGFQSQEQVLEYIVKGTNEQRIHKVESGESFSYIEQIYSLPYGSLEEANPEIKPNRLQIGQEISLIVAEPIINVVSISKVERIDAIAYGKEPNVKTDKYFAGEYFTKRSGILGEAEVVVEVYKENGKVIGEKVLESLTILEPVNKIVYEGTKPAPPKIGTGTFQRPTSRGYITSGFGARWGSFHNGIDIGLPMRSNVYAADGGVVIYSGWKGTFGKLVIIDHGANMLSYYAHNDQLLVGAGEKVFKGQVITYSGNTGRSTGPHLHFEVRKNNRPMNPRNYVNY